MRRLADFLRDTLWVLYALYFRPTELERRLRASLIGVAAGNDPKSLLNVATQLAQPSVRRYLAQIALLCALAAAPFLPLAAGSAPGSGELALTFLVIWMVGLGEAAWDGALGPAMALILALMVGGLDEPTGWLAVLASDEKVSSQLPGVLWGTLIGLGVGFIFGYGAHWLVSRSSLIGNERVVGVVAGVVAGGVAVGVAGGVAFVVAFGVAFGVASVVASGVAFVVAFVDRKSVV